MKNKRILSKTISLILCVLVLLGSVTVAYGNTDVDIASCEGYTEIGTENIGGSSSDGITDSDKSDDEPKVRFFFAFLRDNPGLFNGKISDTLMYGSKINVLGYSGMYTYVEVAETHQKGYIFYLLLDDKFEFNKEYDHVYVNQTNSARLKIKNGADVEWTVSPSGYISVDPETKIITGIKPGTVTITAKGGMSNVFCTVTCINPWKEQETATAEKNIDVFPVYNAGFEKNGIITKGSVITAKGDLADGSGWIYVNSGKTWGFIKLSDFPGIDYLMTQYHYYDKGYEERFGSAESKIFDYASFLNDVMMANFKLKVCPYVAEYTSIADTCKILSYKKVDKNNISKDCPKNKEHKNDSCLKSIYLRDDLKKQFGNGGGTVSKVAWTGHLMSDYENDRSNSTVGMGSIIMNIYGTINSTTIRKDRLYTLTHETGHQLSLNDHYCYGNKESNGGVCTNPYCSDCTGEPLPVGCIMFERINLENTTFTKIYCDNCQNNILNYIKYF